MTALSRRIAGRAGGDGRGRGAQPLRPRERHERDEPERPHAQQRAVGARGGDQQAGRRERAGRGDRARREERAGVAARLALGHEAGEVGEADGADQPGAERRGRERDRALRQVRGRRARQQPAAQQRDARQQRLAQALAGHARAGEHADAGEQAEAGEQDPGRCRGQPEDVLRVQDHERGQCRVGADPEDLRDQDVPRAVPAQHLGEQPQRGSVPRVGVGGLDRRRRPLPRQRRQRQQRQCDRPEHEQRGGGAVDQGAAGDGARERAGQHRALLGARGGGAPVGGEALRDQRAVRRAGGVEPDVDGRGGQREDHVRAGGTERDRDQPARRHHGAAQDERAAGAAAIAPETGRERDREPGRRVDQHHGPDQPRPVGDALEQHGHVGRRDRACGAERDGHRREGPQRGGRGARRLAPDRQRHHAHERASAATRRRRPGATVTAAVVTPSG